MAIVKVDASAYGKNAPKLTPFWKEVGKLKAPGEAVAIPDVNPSNIHGPLWAIRHALGINVGVRTINGKKYVVRL